MRLILNIFLLVLAIAHVASAQTTQPANADASLIVAMPKGWVKSSDLSTMAGLRHKSDSTLIATFHPEGSRPTDLPYALLESIPAPTNASVNGLTASGDRLAAYFSAAIDPPSKADRPGTWKSAIVSKPQYFIANAFFTFRATIKYEGGINGNVTYFVSVIGNFTPEKTTLLTIWTDDAGRSTQGEAIELLAAKGLRENIPAANVPPPVSIRQRMTTIAKISGILLILFVVGVQLLVVWRERRQRRAEELAWREPLV